jgi:hypothetical protein
LAQAGLKLIFPPLTPFLFTVLICLNLDYKLAIENYLQEPEIDTHMQIIAVHFVYPEMIIPGIVSGDDKLLSLLKSLQLHLKY